ncbi:hypothetical protein TNCT_202571, partial [Trichonephila clavata]
MFESHGFSAGLDIPSGVPDLDQLATEADLEEIIPRNTKVSFQLIHGDRGFSTALPRTNPVQTLTTIRAGLDIPSGVPDLDQLATEADLEEIIP